MVGNVSRIDSIKKIYRAEIWEYKSGKTETIYECDKEKNIECKGYNNCRECYLTKNKKFAKDFYNPSP